MTAFIVTNQSTIIPHGTNSVLYDCEGSMTKLKFPETLTELILGEKFSGIFVGIDSLRRLIIKNPAVTLFPHTLPINLELLEFGGIIFANRNEFSNYISDKINKLWEKYFQNIKINLDEKFYLTTAINYTNGPPHIGHAYEIICADVIARYHRILGKDVFFLTGSDEHGQKIYQSAIKDNKTPIEFCNKIVEQFCNLNKNLFISNDRYIRTTENDHISKVKEIISIMKESGDIYLGNYEGWYNVREETFVSNVEAQISNYIDSCTGTPLTKISKESYFFKLSKYQQQIVDYINENESFIKPIELKTIILSRLNDELLDISISRCDFDWGIDFETDSQTINNHIVYVWFDALINYLSGLSTVNFEKFWPPDVQIIGKDITWFHCVVWLGMLFSIKNKISSLSMPKTVFSHGFINDDKGYKMSKSKLNFIHPSDLLDKYSQDSIRLYLVSSFTFGQDISFDEIGLISCHNSIIADNISNLMNRIGSLIKKDFEGVIANSTIIPEDFLDSRKIIEELDSYMINLDLRKYSTTIINCFCKINNYLTENKPWKLVESNNKATIYKSIVESIYFINCYLAVLTPELSSRIFDFMNVAPIAISTMNFGNNVNDKIKSNFYYYKIKK